MTTKNLAVIFILFTVASCTRNSERTTLAKSHADSVYRIHGDKIAAHTFDTLRRALLNAIGSGDMTTAITVCNLQALQLTETYGDSVTIRRTALQYRNSKNKPDSLEEAVLKTMTAQMTHQNVPATQIIRSRESGNVHFFKPIMLQPMCLNCHGIPGKEIQPETLARIHELYPEDKAINFKEGDLRGAWHIIFKEKK